MDLEEYGSSLWYYRSTDPHYGPRGVLILTGVLILIMDLEEY
jgi:hypothetical protein